MANNALEGDWQFVSEKVCYKIVMNLQVMTTYLAGI